MSENRTRVEAPPQVVFEVLRDPASYALWVVGSKHIRGVDATWPRPGSRFHHTVGWGPFQDPDTTEVLEIDPPRRIVLEAAAWPFGTARVELELSPSGTGTDVLLRETPLRGPATKLPGPFAEIALTVRNEVALRRLRRWAEERHRGTIGHLPEPPR